ncbi:peptide-methionine (S)-S-oxide reductase MsrA [Gloeothece verrucosa]|uniref:peptide-methionine (S)-S-oxide reductase MsrA n=1 Tax=Gloeothece verrucosa TaxID=2546359 RepID=UPI0002FB72A0|nr:peptide-methionine (S)-S-oxide reductase MsrA [Gloeothece verrucosa]
MNLVVPIKGASHTTVSAVTPKGSVKMPIAAAPREETAVFAGGCFWGMEAVFEHIKGVSNVVSGFSGDNQATANYEKVSSGNTQHAESVKITYNSSQISYRKLLEIYFLVAHDPTQLNRQGPDIGSQYRSVIFFVNDQQKQMAQAYIAELKGAHIFPKPVVTQLIALKGFYPAEEYHQNFAAHHPNHPYIVRYDLPKLQRLRETFPLLYKK